ncbi:MAG: OmpA family protein [Gammaproteobacteria bacterium]|nr:OmpA family protein [Gammaproteobacteria bacterium]MBI5617167.1 OmpA family protein [Gammaproteobacteria bacterium]
MKNTLRAGAIGLLGIFVAGCASDPANFKPKDIICPVLGGAAGAGIVRGAMGGKNEAEMAAGAVVGAVAGYFICHDKAPAAAPAPAPVAAATAPAPRPVLKDSDGDGVYDDKDKCPGTPPGVKVDATGCPLKGEKLMTLEGVNFDFDKATIRADSSSILDHAVDVLKQNEGVAVSVEGHTDSRGADAYNQKLSEKRAAAVMTYLVKHGISASRLSSKGLGESKPVAPNDTEENMFKNRRVELVVQ